MSLVAWRKGVYVKFFLKYDDSNKSCKWKNAVEERFLYNSLDNFKQKSQTELSWLLMFKSTSMLKSTGGG